MQSPRNDNNSCSSWETRVRDYDVKLQWQFVNCSQALTLLTANERGTMFGRIQQLPSPKPNPWHAHHKWHLPHHGPPLKTLTDWNSCCLTDVDTRIFSLQKFLKKPRRHITVNFERLDRQEFVVNRDVLQYWGTDRLTWAKKRWYKATKGDS